MKTHRIITGAAAILLSVCLICGAAGEAVTKADMYRTGLMFLSLLDADSVETSVAYFESVGNYEQAKRFVMYGKALLEIFGADEDRDSLAMAGVRLEMLDTPAFGEDLAARGLPAVADLRMYVAARELELEGKYAEALAIYGQIGGTLDALERVLDLTISEQDALYKQAVALFDEGKYVEAGDLLRDMKWKDSAELYAICLELHEHIWIDATCETPKTCGWCGATEGEALGHDWLPAAPGEPEICGRCGAVRQESARTSPPEGLRYKVNEWRKTVTITGYDGHEAELVIPDTIEGCTVIGIDSSAFSGNTELITVRLPETIEAFGTSAFAGCIRLTEINFPHELEIIGKEAFRDCTSLTAAVLPDWRSMRSIGDSAFQNCASLTEVWLPGNVLSYGRSMFMGCDGLTAVVPAGSNSEAYCRSNGIPYRTR